MSLFSLASDYVNKLKSYDDELILLMLKKDSRNRFQIDVQISLIEEKIKRLDKQAGFTSRIGREDQYFKLLDKVIPQIRANSMRIASHAQNVLLPGFKETIELGLDYSLRALDSAGASEIAKLAKDAVADLDRRFTRSASLQGLFNSYPKDAVSMAKEVFETGIRLGENPRVIARALKNATAMPYTRAVTVVRTEHARAFNAAAQLNFKLNSDILEGSRRLCARDARTCFLCWALDGEFIPIGGELAMHPNCRCVAIPIIKGWDHPYQTGEEVMLERENENPGYALEFLGPSRYELWKNGDVKLGEMAQITNSPEWGKGVRAKTLVQLKAGS